MSLYKAKFPHVCLKQAVTDIVESIALEEAAISNILSSEGELVRKLRDMKCSAAELLAANKSVNRVIKTALKMQMLLQFKMEDAEEAFAGIGAIEECEDEEE